MNTRSIPRWLEDLPERQQAFDDLSKIVSKQPELAPLKLREVLKIGEGRQVFFVKWHGEKAVLKRFLPGAGDAPDQTVMNLQAELDHLAPRMSDGPYQINRCLLARPDLGFVVLSFAKGKRITDVLSASNPTKRARLMHESGKWLAHYTSDRRRSGKFGPRYWVRRRAEADTTALRPDDQRLLQNLLEALDRWANRLQGCQVTQAAIHGDLSGLNLHVQAGVLTGVDVQGTCWQALSRDVARFLVWQQIKDVQPGSNEMYGINKPDWEAFLSSGVLPTEEHETTLPFFVGDRLFGSLMLDHDKEPSANHARQAIRGFITQG